MGREEQDFFSGHKEVVLRGGGRVLIVKSQRNRFKSGAPQIQELLLPQPNDTGIGEIIVWKIYGVSSVKRIAAAEDCQRG